MAMRSATRAAIVLGIAIGVSAGCGPIEATAVLNDADVALAGARAARAYDHAPYEYVTAELYLEKAREERGFAHFGRAISYGRKSTQAAREAQTKSMERVRESPDSPGELLPYESGSDRD